MSLSTASGCPRTETLPHASGYIEHKSPQEQIKPRGGAKIPTQFDTCGNVHIEEHIHWLQSSEKRSIEKFLWLDWIVRTAPAL